MYRLEQLHPLTIVFYFIAVTLPPALSMHPALVFLSLMCSFLLPLARRDRRRAAGVLFPLLLMLLSAVLNPLFYHNGMTVLFILNDRPVTLEALRYGLTAGGMVAAALYWFSVFSRAMTGDKWMGLLGRLSPRWALLTAMALRFVPLTAAQAGRIHRAQQGAGLYRGENIVDRFRGAVREFSILTTWALENGITTADSMEARGYGSGRRSFYAPCRLTRRDGVFFALTLALTGITLYAVSAGFLTVQFYPRTLLPPATPWGLAGCAAYGLAALMPTLTEEGDRIRWRCLTSGI